VFELTPEAGGRWTHKALHSFNGTDGAIPQGGLIFDAAGNLYGVAYSGGTYGEGTVFELTPEAGGHWSPNLLHIFDGTNGAYPYGGLILDAAGNLYGTTTLGGAYGDGTAFELTPGSRGGWSEKVLHSFGAYGMDGDNPDNISLIFDATGNLYGTTYFGGGGRGTVFEITH
jgi:uncharacterized repeat protein (TIGR03803 family)